MLVFKFTNTKLDKLERLAKDKHSSLLCPFVGYEESEVLWIWLLELFANVRLMHKSIGRTNERTGQLIAGKLQAKDLNRI